MRCARCLNVHLITEEFQGQIIDSCPRCHGVWLPRADFDTLIADRSRSRNRSPPPSQPPVEDDRYYDRRSHDSSGRLPAQGRRRSWLSEITEIFD